MKYYKFEAEGVNGCLTPMDAFTQHVNFEEEERNGTDNPTTLGYPIIIMRDLQLKDAIDPLSHVLYKPGTLSSECMLGLRKIENTFQIIRVTEKCGKYSRDFLINSSLQKEDYLRLIYGQSRMEQCNIDGAFEFINTLIKKEGVLTDSSDSGKEAKDFIFSGRCSFIGADGLHMSSTYKKLRSLLVLTQPKFDSNRNPHVMYDNIANSVEQLAMRSVTSEHEIRPIIKHYCSLFVLFNLYANANEVIKKGADKDTPTAFIITKNLALISNFANYVNGIEFEPDHGYRDTEFKDFLMLEFVRSYFIFYLVNKLDGAELDKMVKRNDSFSLEAIHYYKYSFDNQHDLSNAYGRADKVKMMAVTGYLNLRQTIFAHEADLPLSYSLINPSCDEAMLADAKRYVDGLSQGYLKTDLAACLYGLNYIPVLTEADNTLGQELLELTEQYGAGSEEVEKYKLDTNEAIQAIERDREQTLLSVSDARDVDNFFTYTGISFSYGNDIDQSRYATSEKLRKSDNLAHPSFYQNYIPEMEESYAEVLAANDFVFQLRENSKADKLKA